MIDIHTHILPSMDDGPKTIEESIRLLNILESEAVDTVCLTPHFYANIEDIDTFLKRREESYKSLKKAYKGKVKLILGSEVHYYRGISNTEEINKLKIENSKLLLIELPFSYVNEAILDEIIKLSLKKDIKIVLVHIERYLKSLNLAKIRYLQDSGILIQSNTEFFNNFFTRNRALKMLKEGYINLLGSDSHNLTNRLPNYLKAVKIIEKRLGKDSLERLISNSYLLIK